MYRRNVRAAVLSACLLLMSCSSNKSVEISESANQEDNLVPAQELTAVGMRLEEAKLAITGLGFTWVIAGEDGTTFPTGAEVPGKFNLYVREGIVYRQLVDGVQPYKNVNALSLEEAEDVITANGWTYRVTYINGDRVIDDDSRVAGRYNLWITTLGEVVNHESDTVRLDEIWQPSATE